MALIHRIHCNSQSTYIIVLKFGSCSRLGVQLPNFKSHAKNAIYDHYYNRGFQVLEQSVRYFDNNGTGVRPFEYLWENVISSKLDQVHVPNRLYQTNHLATSQPFGS